MGLFKNAVTKHTEKNANRKFGFKDKLAYAFGDFGCNMSFALNATITTFYTMYIGLSTEIMAIIIILLKIWDGVNDPIMGAIMDRYKPKNGKSKFKVFILWGSIALTVSGALVFLPIAKAPDFVKILSCVLGYLVWDTAYTIVNVPYGSMANVITTKPEERSQLSMWRSVGSMMAQLPVMVLLPAIMYREVTVTNCVTGEEMVGDALIGKNVFIMALVMGFFGFFAFQFLLRMTVERNSEDTNKDEENQNKEKNKVSYFKVIASFAKNRAAVGITIASIFQLIMMNGLSVATAALYKDFFHMGQESGMLQLITFLPLFIAMPLITPLVKKFGKKEASQWPLLLGVLGGALMFILPKEVFLIEKFGLGIALWVFLQLLVSLSFAIFATATWAMVADAIDYQELKTGRREEGTVYSIYSLGRKIAQGFGAAAVLLILGWVGFQEATKCVDPIIGEYEVPAIQTAVVANRIRIVVGAVYCFCSLVQFIMIAFVFPLSKKKVKEMNYKLGRIENLNKKDTPFCELDEAKLPVIKNRKIAVGITSILLYPLGIDKFLMYSKRLGKEAIKWTVLSIIFFFIGAPFLIVRSIKGIVKGIKVLRMNEEEYVNYVREVNTILIRQSGPADNSVKLILNQDD